MPSNGGGSGNEFHNQLKDIEQRMQRTANLSKSLKDTEQELESHLQTLKTNGDDDQAQALRSKLSDIKNEYDNVLKENDSLRVNQLTASNSAVGQGTISPSKKPSRKHKQQNLSKGNDVEFAAGLSEGLLVQCRKLQSMINDRDKSVRELKDELETYQAKFSSLESQIQSMSEAEERFKDENWNLELQVQELRKEAMKHSESLNKATTEAGKLEKDKNTQLETIESLKVKEAELRQEITALKNKHEVDTNAFKKEQEELRNENTQLHTNLTDLKQEMDSRPLLAPPSGEYGNYDDLEQIEEENEFDTPSNSPPSSPLKQTPARKPALEAETVKSSLGHAHKLITNLRKALQREKSEKVELERMLSDTREELENSSSAPTSLKSKRSRQKVGAVGQLGGVRKPISRVYTDDDDEGRSEGWEETTSESEFQSAFETAPDDPTDDNYQTGLETMDEGSDGQDTETEDSSAPRAFGFRVDNTIVTSSDEDDNSLATPHDRARRRNSRYRRSQYSLRHTASMGGAGSSTNENTPVKKSLADEFMSLDDIEQRAADHGMVCVSNEEYEELTNQQVPSTQEELQDLAKPLDLAVVPVPRLKELETTANDVKSKDYIIKAAEGLGLVAVAKAAYDRLNKPSIDDIHTHAKSLGLTALKSDDHAKHIKDHEALVAEHGKITKEHADLAEKHSEFEKTHESMLKEHQVLTKEHESLVSENTQTLSTLEELKKEHESVEKELQGSKDAYEQLTQELAKSEKDHGALVAEHGVLVQDHAKLVEDNDRLRKEATRDLTPEELETKAGKIGFVAVKSDDYYELSRRVKSPSVEEVQAYASAHSLVTVPRDEHERLVNPTEDDLKQKADSLGFTVVDLSHYKELTRQSQTPSAEEVTARAEKLGLAVIAKNELSTLTKNSNEPTLDHLHDKVKAHNSRIVAEDDYAQLSNKAESPDADHIIAKAGNVGMKAIPIEEYNDLAKRADEPSEDHIKTKATAAGLIALGVAEHKKLVRAVEKPTRDEVESKAKDLGLVTLDKEAHDDLSRAANSPTIDELSAKASALGYTAVVTDEYNTLKQKAEEPTSEEVQQHATKIGLVAVPKEEYTKLSNPTVEDVEKAASSHGLVAVPIAKYQNIKDAAEAPPTKQWVESAAASLGLATLATAELTKLKQPAPEPTLADAKKIAEKNGHAVLTNGDVNSMKNPTAEQVSKMAGKHGFKTVTEDKYKELTKPYAPSQSEIEAKAESFGLVAISEATYSKLTADLTKDQVVEKARGHGLVAVADEEYQELSSRPKEYKPTVDELSAHAKQQGMSIVPVDEYEGLVKRANEPDRQAVEQAAGNLGLVMLPVSEMEELKRKSASPSKEELTTMATQSGYALVSVSGLQELNKKAEEPSKDVVLNSADRLGLKMLSIQEHQDLSRQAYEPTVEELKSAATQHSMDIVSTSHLAELNRRADEPTAAELQLACDANDMVCLSKAEHEQLEKNAEEPDRDLLNKHAVRLGLSMLAAGEIEELRRKSTATKDNVEEMAKKLGMVAITTEQYNSMVEKVDKPNSSNSLLLSSVAAKRDHFEDMINKSKGSNAAQGEKIVESMKSLGYVPVAADEYKRLMENQQAFEPTRREVLRHVKNLGMVAIAADEYKSLVKRGHVSTPSVSSDVVDEALASPSTPVKSPRTHGGSTASPRAASSGNIAAEAGLDMQSVPTDYLASLRKIAENPTKEDVQSLAKKVGLVSLEPPADNNEDTALVAVSADEYSRLQNYTADVDVISARAKELGLVTLTTEEYLDISKDISPEDLEKMAKEQGLAVSSKEDVQQRAKEFGLVAVEQGEYEKSQQSLSKEELQSKAEALGLVAVEQDHYNQLQQDLTKEELQSKAEELGLVAVPMHEYDQLQTPMDVIQVQDEVRKHGFVPVPIDSYTQLTKRPAQLTAENIKEEAEKIGFVAVPSSDYEQPRGGRISMSSDSSMYLSPEEIQQHADHAGLRAIPVAEYEGLRGKKKKIDETDLHEYAKQLGMVVISSNEFRRLSNPPPPHTPPTPKQWTVEDVRQEARKLGLVVNEANNIPQSNSEATLKEVRGSPVVVSTPRHQVQSAVVEDTSSDTSGEGYMRSSTLSPVMEDGIARNISNGSKRTSIITNSPGSQVNLAVSNATITTATSLTEKNMIPYVTQIMIGEFLFKYVRRLGSVSGISDNRHERYFWVHPYSMTLFWDKDNPGTMGTHNSSKTRAAGILSVQSVDDPNPLPPGLYHKSLLIETTERTIKITCPNRKRHNVWFNALQFLLKRSADDLNLEEDDEEGEYQEAAQEHSETDTRFERERARTVSSASKQSGKQPRILSLRRSLAPEMNNARTSRHPSTSSFQRPRRASNV